MRTHTLETQQSLTPAEALKILEEGNARFRANLKANRNLLQQVNETRDGQWPFAAILSCIDSRTSAELIFDQGLGDIFSVRIAGNFVNDDILGSLEFSCRIAGAKVVVVVGHSECGAIKGACDHVELGHLGGMLKKIQPSVQAICGDASSSKDPAMVQAVARENVRRTVAEISERSSVLAEMKAAGELEIVGAFYDVASGAVEFLPRES